VLSFPPYTDKKKKIYNINELTLLFLFITTSEALKLAQVDMYTRRLRERARRKRVSRDFQLVSQFFSANRKDRPSAKKKLSKEEK
jgi:hypothetical protein